MAKIAPMPQSDEDFDFVIEKASLMVQCALLGTEDHITEDRFGNRVNYLARSQLTSYCYSAMNQINWVIGKVQELTADLEKLKRESDGSEVCESRMQSVNEYRKSLRKQLPYCYDQYEAAKHAFHDLTGEAFQSAQEKRKAQARNKNTLTASEVEEEDAIIAELISKMPAA